MNKGDFSKMDLSYPNIIEINEKHYRAVLITLRKGLSFNNLFMMKEEQHMITGYWM